LVLGSKNEQIQHTAMKSAVLFAVLAALWLLLSGKFSPLFLFLGAASCVLVVWLARRFETVDRESIPLHLGWGIVPYWLWLLKEIVVSALQVSKIILSPTLRISPTMVQVQSRSGTEVGHVLFGNSITLTPGTLTTDIDDSGLMTVHALTAEGAQGVLTSDMNQRVSKLAGEP
jgi:multicomponent Na+:H+ antiporter subunit E